MLRFSLWSERRQILLHDDPKGVSMQVHLNKALYFQEWGRGPISRTIATATLPVFKDESKVQRSYLVGI